MQPWQPYQSSGYPPPGYGYGYAPGYGYPFYSATPQYSYASFWRRLVAIWLDSLIISTCYAVYLLFYVATTGFPTSSTGSGEGSAALALWIPGFVAAAYYVVLNGHGGTLGKRALGIRVTDRAGNPPGLRRGALRSIIPMGGLIIQVIVAAVTAGAEEAGRPDVALTASFSALGIVFGYCIFSLVDDLSMIGDDHKQTLHDKMGGTYVIRG